MNKAVASPAFVRRAFEPELPPRRPRLLRSRPRIPAVEKREGERDARFRLIDAAVAR